MYVTCTDGADIIYYVVINVKVCIIVYTKLKAACGHEVICSVVSLVSLTETSQATCDLLTCTTKLPTPYLWSTTVWYGGLRHVCNQAVTPISPVYT